jgi:hypothetical protein
MIRVRSNGGARIIDDQAFTGFDSSNPVWDELGISAQQWDEWWKSVSAAGRHIPVVPDLPELSKLAYIDEGVISFDPKLLRDDCMLLLPTLKTAAAKRLVGDLLGAALAALSQESAEVITHPYIEASLPLC